MKFLNLKVSHSLSQLSSMRALSYSSQKAQLNKQPLPHKTFFNSNAKDSLISRLCDNKNFKEAIDILCEQKRLREAVQLLDQIDRLNALVYSNLIQHCLQDRALEEGKKVHAHTKASGFVAGVFICNRFLDMYVKCGSLEDAQRTFDEMAARDLCSWNTMISGYAKMGKLGEARKLFNEMPERDNFSWTAVISGCARHDRPKEALELYRMMLRHENSNSNYLVLLLLSAAIRTLRTAKETRGYITRIGLDWDEVVWSALSDMYGKCGSIEEAGRVFDKTVGRDVVSWTAMIL